MDKQMNFTLFQSLTTSQPPRNVTLDEVRNLIVQDAEIKENTEKYRYFLKNGFEKDADRIKRSKSPALMPAAFFASKRNYKNLLRWTNFSLVDFDDLTETQLQVARERLQEDPYWVLIHVTYSGKGLRIIFRVHGVVDKQTYLKAFQQGNFHYCRLLGIDGYDAKVKDATRGSALCHDPNALFRSDAKPFPVNYKTLTVADVWLQVEEKLAAKGLEYVAGRHNEYICQAIYWLNKYGIKEKEALKWALERFSDYDASSVKSSVRSCYGHTEEHGCLTAPKKKTKEKKDTVNIERIEMFIRHRVDIRFNIITRMNEIRWKKSTENNYRNLTDKDECTLWRLFCKQYGLININHILQVIASDFVPCFDPFKDYFAQLPTWNPGDTDYLKLLADTVTLVDHSEEAHSRFTHCLSKWMVAMVAGFLSDRINHEILVFIGRQGIYKTTWFHYLLPPELRNYFVPKINSRRMSKDDRLLLSEAGLICLEEIVSMRDSDIEQIKAVVTLPQVVERAAYARNKEVRPHIASFCGTGNQLNFLTDDDNRRWLPFEVENIRNPYRQNTDYTGLYAQVKYYYEHDFVYWFDRKEIDSLKSHIRNFEMPCLEEELILTYYRKPQPGEQGIFVTTADVLGKINLFLKIQLSPVKIGKIMRRLGFETVRSSDGRRGYRVYEYNSEEVRRNKKRFGECEQMKIDF